MVDVLQDVARLFPLQKAGHIRPSKLVPSSQGSIGGHECTENAGFVIKQFCPMNVLQWCGQAGQQLNHGSRNTLVAQFTPEVRMIRQ